MTVPRRTDAHAKSCSRTPAARSSHPDHANHAGIHASTLLPGLGTCHQPPPAARPFQGGAKLRKPGGARQPRRQGLPRAGVLYTLLG